MESYVLYLFLIQAIEGLGGCMGLRVASFRGSGVRVNG